MKHCIFCCSELTEETSPEHILLQSLGGRKTAKYVICSKCNNAFGSSIDKALAKSVEAFRNIGNFKSGNRRPSPSIPIVEADGRAFKLGPGAVPTPLIDKKLEITELLDGKICISIRATSRDEFETLLNAVISKHKLSEGEARKLKSEAFKSATVHSSPAPEFTFQTSYGDVDSLRSMAKACLVFWADSVGTNEVMHSRYRTIREFISDQKIPDSGVDLVAIDTRPHPKFDARFGSNPNIVWVGSDHQGRVVGYFRLYGAIGWSIELANKGAPTNQSFCLISNPEDPSNWSDSLNETNVLVFDWVSERQEAPDFEAVNKSIRGLLANSFDRARVNYLTEIAAAAFKAAGVREGQIATEKQRESIFKKIAWEAAHAFLKLPFTRPLDQPPPEEKL